MDGGRSDSPSSPQSAPLPSSPTAFTIELPDVASAGGLTNENGIRLRERLTSVGLEVDLENGSATGTVDTMDAKPRRRSVSDANSTSERRSREGNDTKGSVGSKDPSLSPTLNLRQPEAEGKEDMREEEGERGRRNTTMASSGLAALEKERLLQNQLVSLVLEFKSDGSRRFLELRRDDILRIVRDNDVVPPIREDDPRLTNEREMLEKLREKVPKELQSLLDTKETLMSRVRFKGTLQKRDIRVLDSSFVHAREPAFLVRRHAILINLWPIKALLFHDKMMIFVPDGADSVLATLMGKLQVGVSRENPDYKDMAVPFVLRSLEAILVTMCTEMDDEVAELVPSAEKTVQEVVRTSSGVTIERLRQAKTSVTDKMNRLLSIQTAFEELLGNDRDMALMKLDNVFAFPDYYDEKNCESWEVDHEEIELLLENYAQSIDGSIAKVSMVLKEIDSAMATISLKLDTARNKLLGVDLLVNSVTSVAALGALFAGLFGMNLDSGVQDAPYWFWAWFSVIVGGVPVIVSALFYLIYKRGLLIN